MHIVTTPTIENREITKYLGIVGAEIIFGANYFRDASASIRDVIGGRSKEYEEVFSHARETAIKTLESNAAKKGADAVIGVRFDYHTINAMMMVAATGTAVRLKLSEKAEEREDEFERNDEAMYFVNIEGNKRGPFSKNQLRELFNTGRIGAEDAVYADESGKAIAISELLKA